jgi:hypothetical protein
MLPSEKDAIDVVRSILSLLVQEGIFFDKRIRQGLVSLFYTALGPANDDLEGIRQLLEKLSDFAQSLPHASAFPLTKPAEASAPLLTYPERKRIGQLMMELNKQGFEHRLELRNFKKRTGRTLRSRRLARQAAAAALERESAEWIRSYSDQVFPYDTDPLVGYHKGTDHDFASIDAHGSVPSGTSDRRFCRKDAAEDQKQKAGPSSSPVEVVSKPVAPQPEVAKASETTDVALEDLEESLSAAGYAMRLRVFSVIRRDHVAAAHLFRSMRGNGVRPSMLHVAPIVEGLCLDGRVDEARDVAQNASKKFGVIPTARVQSAILRGLIQEDRLSEARSELQNWVQAGGRPNGYLQHLFDDSDFPRLAKEQTFRVALAEAQAADEPLNLSEVDDAFRFLIRTQRFVSAQRVVLQAVQQTGTRADYSLRVAVRNASQYLRKVLRRKGVEPEAEPSDHEEEDKDRVYLFTPPSASLLSLPSRRLSSSDDTADSPLDLPAENDDDSLRSALSLSTQLTRLLHVPSNKELQRQKAARAQFRHDLETLVMDIARGMYSVAAVQGKPARVQRKLVREAREQLDQSEGTDLEQQQQSGGVQLREKATEKTKQRVREKEEAMLRAAGGLHSPRPSTQRERRQQGEERQRVHHEAGIVAAGWV